MAEKIWDDNDEEEEEFDGVGCCGAAANDARVEEEIEVEGNVSKDEKEVVMEDVGCYWLVPNYNNGTKYQATTN